MLKGCWAEVGGFSEMSLAIFAEKSAYSLRLPTKKLGFRVVVVLGISARCQGRLKRRRKKGFSSAHEETQKIRK